MQQRTTLCALLAVLVCSSALAAEPAPKLKGSKKLATPRIDLGLPSFEGTPDAGLQKMIEKPAVDVPSDNTSTNDLPYEITSVTYAKQWVRTPRGLKVPSPLTAIKTHGDPAMSERFTSILHIKAPGKRGALIELKVVDSQGDQVMSAEGQVVFRTDEIDWTVDWAPAFVRRPGECQLQIRIGTQPVVSFPLKLEP